MTRNLPHIYKKSKTGELVKVSAKEVKALAEAFTYDDMVEIKVSETKAKKALIIEGEENQ